MPNFTPTRGSKNPTAVQLPSGNWRCRVSYTDEEGVQHKNSFTEPSKAVSEAKAIAWKAGIIKECSEKKNITLETAIDEYINTCRVQRRSPATIGGYLTIKRNGFPNIIHKQVRRLTLRDIQRQIDERAQSVSPKTLRNDFGLLGSVLKFHRPDLNLKTIRLPETDDEETVIPDDDEARLLMEAAKADKDMYCAVLLAITTGLRRSEICALEWKDIDAEAGTLSVTKAMVLDRENHVWVIKGPKKKSSKRVIRIEDEVVEELMKNRTGFKNIVNINPNMVSNRFTHLRDGLGLHQIHFHTLRHYKASVLLCLGYTPEFARRRLGHATDNMVKRVYGHLNSGAKSEADRLESEHTIALLKGDKITYLPRALSRVEEN